VKRAHFLLAIAFLLFIPLFGMKQAAAATTSSQFTQPYYVNVASNDKLNVRKLPSANATIIGSLARGTKVYAAYKVNNGWYYIKYGSLIGYVNGAYLQTTPPKTIATSAQFTQPYYVNVAANSKLNVRKSPSTSAPIVGSLTRGLKVYAAYKVNGWYYIKYGNLIGYVYGAYLQTAAPAAPVQYDSRLKNQVIIIDPGHGGTDPGASGFGLKEKDVVLDTGLRLRNILAKSPFQVKMTRSTDTFVSLQGRVDFAIKNKGNVFLSIHANSGSGTGTETYYYGFSGNNPYKADSQLLASKIENRLHSAMGLTDRGVKSGDLHVLRENRMPAMLAEIGFIDNKSDNAKLASSVWRQKAANAIYLGLLDYYKAKGYNVSSLYSLVN
jgi:N-acetylmuramoyl-L-alanine amidase